MKVAKAAMMKVGDVVAEAAIGWLVQSILGNMFTEKLEEWTCRVGLADDVKKLKLDMRFVQKVVASAMGRKIQNEPLAQSLGDLRELLYDAEDVMDELDYYRLQEQVTCDNTTTSAWFTYVKKIGSTLIDKCGNFVSKGNSSSGKRKRDDWDIDANKHLRNKTQLSRRIKQIASDLRRVGQDVCGTLKIDVSNFVGTSSSTVSTAEDMRLTSSYPVESIVYGRQSDKETILKLMTSNDRSDRITVQPIFGIGGIGKTTLAKLVYNDQIVKSHFQIKIWVCVSDNFSVQRLTREMLECVSNKQRLEEIMNLDNLKQHLEKQMKSKRFLVVLDDVWGDKDGVCVDRWKELLAPLEKNQAKGNMILVTTRNLAVAKMIGTTEPIMLGPLEGGDFWRLFESYAFGDQEYEDRLYDIGKQIAEDLKGNPLAAKTVGALLRRKIGVGEWQKILKNEEWKSLQHSRGIMAALKLSYDYLPKYLQQCFRYCCLFPKDYHFDRADLVRIWISQGFVTGNNMGSDLEDKGKVYLDDLVNSGFFEQVRRDWDSPESFVMHDLMHDLARKVSRAEFANIDDPDCEQILPTVRHLSIVTNSAFSPEILRRKLRQESVRKLRSLVLLGHYDLSFFQDIQEMFEQAENLRLLQICASYADFVSFLHNLKDCAHLRYIKLIETRSSEVSPISLSKFYHLEVLDVGQPAIVHDMNDLVSMRYLFVTKGSLSNNVGEMSDDHNVQNGTDQNSKCSEIAQLQSMNKLVQLGVFYLGNISRPEADGAKLSGKQQLEKLHLSWKNTLSQHDSDTEEAEEESRTADDIGQDSGPLIDRETEMESSQMNGTNDNSFIKKAEEVLDGLEPHDKLKHLQISGYSGSTYPAWLATSVTCLQTLHLEDCGEWQILPALEKFPSLTKLTLRNMRKLKEVSIPSLEELVLIKMPKLTSCCCSSVRGLNSSLRVLKIQRCRVLETFPLFERYEKLNIKKKSWLSHLIELTIHDCPNLMVSYPLPHSDAVAQLSIFGVPELPTMEGSSRGTLTIGFIDEHELTSLDCNVLAFHNLRLLSHLIIDSCCIELTSVAMEGFSQLINLKRLEMKDSLAFFPAGIAKDMPPANFAGLRSLNHLTLLKCEVEWIWLSGMLRHVEALEELYLDRCDNLKAVTLEDEETSQANLSSAPEASTSENPYDASQTCSDSDGLLRISSNIISSLREMSIVHCGGDPTFCGRKDGFSRFTCLEDLMIWGCPKLISSLLHKAENNETSERWLLPNSLGKLEICFERLGTTRTHEIPDSPKTLQLCFPVIPDNLSCLQNLTVFCWPNLRSLQLHSCTALEELDIYDCKSLTALEGLEILGVLRNLKVSKCPGFPRCLEDLPRQGFDLRPLRLQIGDCDILTTSFCSHLASLQLPQLQFYNLPNQVTRLTDAQESALPLLTSLQELSFYLCYGLEDLPKGLHSLRSLKRLEIKSCSSIKRLPETGLPPTLEELDVSYCSKELTEQCRELATSKVKVKIDGNM